MYTLLLAVIYLAFISLGLPDSLLGSAWPVMHQTLAVPLSYMGIVTMIISGGTIVSSLLSERLTKKLGTQTVTVISVALTAAALFGFSSVRAFPLLCVWAIPYGLGAGAIDAALNNYVALHYSSRHMSWLHSFWGVGTVISPYVMSYALSHRSWEDGYRIVGWMQGGIVLVLLLTLPLWKINKAEKTEESTRVIGLRTALKIPGVRGVLVGFFAYCAAETTVIQWTSSYLAGVRGVSERLAAAFASFFYIGMTVGRFLSGFAADRLGDRRMIRIGITTALVGAVCVLLPLQTTAVALVGFVIIGLGCAPVYPAIIHSTPTCFGADNAQAIIGVQMASAYVGSTFMPPLFGVLAEYTTLLLLPLYLALFLGLSFLMLERAYKKA